MVRGELVQPYPQRVTWTRPGQSEHHISLAMGIGRWMGIWDVCWAARREAWAPVLSHWTLTWEDTDTGSWRACQREESRAGRTRAGGFGWPRPHSLTQLCLPYLTALYESLRPCVSGTRVFFCQIKVRFLTVAAGDSYLLSILSSLCKWGN